MNELLILNLKGALILALGWAASGLLVHRSATSRHAVWSAAFAALLIVAGATVLLPPLALPVLPAQAPSAGDPNAFPMIAPAAEGSGASSARERSSAGQLPGGEAQPPAGGGVTSADGGRRLPRAGSILLTLWAIGAVLLVGRCLLDDRRLRGITRRAAPAPASWAASLSRCRRRIGPPGGMPRRLRRVELRVSPEVAIPMVWGSLRPVVLLPISARRWSTERREVVLLHELGHVRRYDHATVWLADLASALYWPNPFVWFAARRLREERERACDELVLGAGADNVEYAAHLLAIVRGLAPGRGPMVALADRAGVRARIEAILGASATRRVARPRTIVGFGLVALLLAIPFAGARLTVAPIEAAPTAAVATVWSVEELDGLVDQLQRGGPQARRRAAWALGDLEDPRAVEPLISALSSPDATLRGVAAWALGEIKRRSALPALIDGLVDADPVVREIAARAIGELGDPRAIDRLVAALDDSSGDVRAAALWSLGEIATSRALRAVERGLADPHPGAWQTAAQVLVAVRSPAALQPLLDRLVADDPDSRRIAAIHLGRLQRVEAVDALVAALEDDVGGVRQAATRALGLIGDPRAVDALIGRLRDERIEVRSLAVWALDEIQVDLDAAHPKSGFDDEELPGIVHG